MKKILTGIFALSLVASMSFQTFAVTNDGTSGTDITVNGTYQAAEAPADVTSVDIVWDAMDFTYTAPSKGTWNASTHEYENATEGGWAGTGGTDPKITVTNHSNVPVNANFAFATAVDGLNGSFTKNALVLDSAEGTELSNAPKGETAFSVSGSDIDTDKSLGKITVTVTKDTTQYVSTAEEYVAAIAKGGTVKLTNDIENLSWNFSFAPDVVIDMDGHELSAYFSNFKNLTLKNGTVRLDSNPIFNSGSLTLTDCTVCGNTYNSSVINTTDDTAQVTLLGEIRSDKTAFTSFVNGGDMTCLAGTYNFDVSSYVDTNVFAVTENTEAGTWTVTAK